MNERKAEVRRKYDTTAKAYDTRYTEIQNRKYLEVFSKFDVKDSDVVVDVGAGTGLLLDFLHNNKGNIFCCDLSFNMLKEGKKKHQHNHFICADSEHLPFRESSANIVTSFTVFQNLPNPSAVMNQIIPILKYRGALILTALQKKYKIEDLRKLIAQTNLKIVTIWNLTYEDTSVIARKVENKY
ncbi:MAG: class I SAM-dependent methyltransferase [Candidatus Heimdallarchaeota archaeon]|nr:class I SAM-dependent methyltransferase [Candidatus Heimdallarchaeota archaeon]MCK4878035.1 class I SAM-dependent methyltransferase [Candidatus Heimdallarchaeota archaeon]